MTDKKKLPPMPPKIEILGKKDVRIDGDTQPRAELNNETIFEYMDAMIDGRKFPPLTVFFDGKDRWLADGFHRYWGYDKAKILDFPCEVRQGTVEDARWYSLSANRTHGLRRSNADKHRAVALALKQHAELSDHAIADHVGVSQPFVSDLRNQLITVISSTDAKRLGLDGKMRPVRKSNFPANPPPSQPKNDTMAVERTLAKVEADPCNSIGKDVMGCCQCEDHICTSREVKFGNAFECKKQMACSNECPRLKEKFCDSVIDKVAPVLRDKIGRRIPEELKEIWGRRQEALDLLTALRNVKSTVQAAETSKDKLFSEVTFANFKGHLEQAYVALKVALPYAVCPYCQGVQGCKVCCERGFVSKYRWDIACAKEFKDAVIKGVKKELGKDYEAEELPDEGV